ncbi:glycosyltransferase family 2 protein [Halobacteriovorax marinus]|uniref:glycosyltransferase family 2 protein n=1 Tax=Halobacteriovorax marinus TaxID=97084 RepID=UPI003A903DF9
MTKIDEKELISVILPVFNGEKFVHKAISSILKQSYKNFELIVVNDGSSDSSLHKIQEIQKTDKRIILINRENKGLIASLNEAVEVSKGQYIARMDADDICHTNRLEKQIELMKKESLDICGCHYFLINENDEIIDFNLVPTSHETCTLSLASKVPFAHPSVIIKKKFLTDHSLAYGQSEYLTAEDFDLWSRMFQKGAKFGNVKDVLFRYRILDNSLSKTNQTRLILDAKGITYDFVNNNKHKLKKLINTISIKHLNNEEKSLFIRASLRTSIKTLNFSLLRKLKYIESKIVVTTLLSELYQWVRS